MGGLRSGQLLNSLYNCSFVPGAREAGERQPGLRKYFNS